MSDPTDNDATAQDGSVAGKLHSLLGFDPSRNTRLTKDLFSEIVTEISKERTDLAKGKAKELLTKAISLREQAAKAKREFDSQSKKFDKELSKVIGAIQGLLDGRPPQPEGDESEPPAA